MELIRCPRCAKEIPEDSRFCRRCGCSVGWGLEGGMSPTWSSLSNAGVFAARPVTLATTAATASASSARRPRPNVKPAAERKPSGGALAASAMIGVAAVTFFSHVQRSAVRTPATPSRSYEELIRPSPVRSGLAPPRSYPRSLPSDSINWPFAPGLKPPAPPVIVAPEPSRPWERQRTTGPRTYREREDRARQDADPVDDWPRLLGR